MTPQYEATVLDTFYSFYEKGFVYKGLRAFIGACMTRRRCGSGSEYENKTSPTIWVKYALLDNPAKIDPALKGKKVSTIIYTTATYSSAG